MKKALLAAILALSFFASIGLEGHAPPPECNPCPAVR